MRKAGRRCCNIPITLRTPPARVGHLARRAKRGVGWSRILPLSDGWSLADVVRKAEVRLLQLRSLHRGQHQPGIFLQITLAAKPVFHRVPELIERDMRSIFQSSVGH